MWFQFKEIGSRELNVELQVDNIESELEGIIEQLDRVFVVSGMNCDLKTGKVEIKLVPGNGFLHVADQEEPVRKVHKQEREEGSRKGNRWYTHAERQYLNSVFESNLNNYQAIAQAAGKLGRTTGAIERQLYVFMTYPDEWAKWIQGGNK